jgi:hypothetical protein
VVISPQSHRLSTVIIIINNNRGEVHLVTTNNNTTLLWHCNQPLVNHHPAAATITTTSSIIMILSFPQKNYNPTFSISPNPCSTVSPKMDIGPTHHPLQTFSHPL